MQAFLDTVFIQDTDLDRVIKRYTLRPDKQAIFDSFEIPMEHFGISDLNRWTIALDAMRAETAFARMMSMNDPKIIFSHFYPLSSIEYFRQIALACKEERRLDALRWTTAMNAFAAIIQQRLNGEPVPYLGTAAIALTSYGMSLTAHLPQLGLKLQSY